MPAVPSPELNSQLFQHAAAPTIWRRLATVAYEFCLLFGVTFIAAYVWLTLLQWRWPLDAVRQSIFQFYLFVVLGTYFSYFWHRGGQTLAMKTWRVRLITQGGAPLSLARAWLRYALLWSGLIPSALVLIAFNRPAWAMITFLSYSSVLFAWMLFDRDRQFLHDRLLKIRLISVS